MKLFYWPTESNPEALKLHPGFRGPTSSFNMSDDMIREHVMKYWNKIGENCIILAGYNYESQASLYEDENGKVTVDSMAYFIRKGLSGILKHAEWWEHVCQLIDEMGYRADTIAMDIEGGLPTWNYKYRARDNSVSMFDALDIINQNERWKRSIPRLNYEILKMPAPYNTQVQKQLMLAWDHWVYQQSAIRFKEVYHEITKKYWPRAQVVNYEYNNYETAPLMTFSSVYAFLPRPDRCAVAGVSCPVLYPHKLKYRDYDEAIAALDMIREPYIPWIPGDYHEGEADWFVTKEGNEKLLNELKSRGVRKVLVF